MSNISERLKISAANQDLFTDLTEQDAEAINGGAEVFTIEQPIGSEGTFYIDDTAFTHRPYETWEYTAYNGGIISFDTDGRTGVESIKKYNLANGGQYSFQYNTSTSDPYDIDLYDIG
jgi:hypothetical protein